MYDIEGVVTTHDGDSGGGGEGQVGIAIMILVGGSYAGRSSISIMILPSLYKLPPVLPHNRYR